MFTSILTFCDSYFDIKETGVLLNLEIHYMLADNKVKIPIGEPGCPVSTGAPAYHKKLTTTSNDIKFLDHGYHKGSMTPSVDLGVSIPVSRHGSWHTDNINVLLKGSVFKGSTIWQQFT